MNCCKDYQKFCNSKATCKGHCNEYLPDGLHCSCDATCDITDTCCLDYKDVCGKPGPGPGPTPTPSGSCYNKCGKEN